MADRGATWCNFDIQALLELWSGELIHQHHTNSNAQVMISKFNCCFYSSGPTGVLVELFKQSAQASYTTNQAIIILV